MRRRLRSWVIPLRGALGGVRSNMVQRNCEAMGCGKSVLVALRRVPTRPHALGHGEWPADSAYEDFMIGFVLDNDQVRGRPAGMAVDPGGRAARERRCQRHDLPRAGEQRRHTLKCRVQVDPYQLPQQPRDLQKAWGAWLSASARPRRPSRLLGFVDPATMERAQSVCRAALHDVSQ